MTDGGPLFIEQRRGRLMRLEENEVSRYQFEIWFEYTRMAMEQVREGAMVAVPNFASRRDEPRLSILEITSLKPVHYALGDSPDGYPAFVMEAARNAAQDWTTQEDRSDEDTTIIRCTAIPTNLELRLQPMQQPQLAAESNIPMIGADARLLATSLVERVVNRDIGAAEQSIAVAGRLIRDDQVEVLVRVEELFKLHFGVFGFTGAGKSNLVSTLVSDVFSRVGNGKVVLFDLMGEYGTLLLDRLIQLDDGRIVVIGDRSLPGAVLQYIGSDQRSPNEVQLLQDAARQLANFFVLPPALLDQRPSLVKAFARLLRQRKIRVYSEVQGATVRDIFSDDRFPLRNRQQGRGKPQQDIRGIMSRVLKGNSLDSSLGSQLASDLLSRLQDELSTNQQYEGDFKEAAEFLQRVQDGGDSQPLSAISQPEILGTLARIDRPGLLIVIAANPDELRRFARRFGEAAYENRRQTGTIEPLVSFIFDEADEFIPQQADGSYGDSRAIAETLARRGRKFGLGLGLATQRIIYLDTSIMAQPHTYLVSKLPRKSDRERIADAFGMSEEMLRQTFTFQAGDWLLVSHDATGLKAIPVPVRAGDANQRLRQYLQSVQPAPATAGAS